MTAPSGPSNESIVGTPPNRGVKKGLPATGLRAAEDAAGKLWEVARLGTASPEAFARQFGEKAKASGSTWDTRLAVLRGFKLVRFEGKQIGLSELGQRLVNISDSAGQIKARQTAVMNLKAYRELVDAFDGTALPDMSVLATRLQFEYGKNEDFAGRAAQAFVDSLKHADMLDQDNVVRKAGVTAAVPVVPPGLESLVKEPVEPDDDEAQAAEIDRAFDGDDPETQVGEAAFSSLQQVGSTPVAPNVSLAVTLDLSNFRADEVVKILATLGFGRGG
jgi:hypothetical protein